jgi:hypothetical protein
LNATAGQRPASPAIRRNQRAEARDQTESLIRDAHVILAGAGVRMPPGKVARLAHRYTAQVRRNGVGFFDYLTNSVALDAEQRRAALADPDVRRIAEREAGMHTGSVIRIRSTPRWPARTSTAE